MYISWTLLDRTGSLHPTCHLYGMQEHVRMYVTHVRTCGCLLWRQVVKILLDTFPLTIIPQTITSAISKWITDHKVVHKRHGTDDLHQITLTCTIGHHSVRCIDTPDPLTQTQ